jgi:dolichyl-phosphate-mannose-protein mannosyltransferase
VAERSTTRVPRGVRVSNGQKPPTRSARAPALAWLAGLACVAMALWVHRAALGAYFSPDDLISFERARGLLPPHPLPWWRFLSGPVYFTTGLRVFGVDPFPFHLVNWLAHGMNVVLLFRLMRRWSASTSAAIVASGVFGTSRLAHSALLQAVGVGELLATTGLLLSLLTLDANRPRSWWRAGLLFAAALLCKESVLLLPAVVLLPLPPRAPTRRRLGATAALLAASGLLLLLVVLAHGRSSAFAGEAYAVAFGANLFHNLMTYASWTLDYRTVLPDIGGGVVPIAWRTGLPVMLGLGVLVALRPTPRAMAGLLWFVLALLPVLPLLHHSYLQYAYAALAGVSIVLAEAWDGAIRPLARRLSGERGPHRDRRSMPAPAGRMWVPVASAMTLVVALALAGEHLVDRRWNQRIPGRGFHVDPMLRKSEVIRHVSESLRPALDGRRTRLVFVEPAASHRSFVVGTGREIEDVDPSAQDLLSRVLDTGRGLRALYTGLDSVVFVERWSAAFREFDLVANTPDGYAVDVGQGPDAHLRFARALVEGGYARVAIDHLAAAAAAYPTDPRLGLALVEALARGGRRAQALALAAAMRARFPHDSAVGETERRLRE